MRRLAGLSALMMVFTSFVGQASARILFQDDTVGTYESENLNLGSNDAGANNTSLKFGADSTASENGNITWNIGTNSFGVDHTVDVTGGLSATGQVNFSGAAGLRVRENADPATNSACAVKGELIYDTTDDELQICTVVGGAGAATWVAVDSPAAGVDFEAVYGTDADKTLSVTDNLATGFAINEGANNYLQVVTTDGAEAINLNQPTNLNGIVTIGDGGDTVEINSSDWKISPTGAVSGIDSISANDNQATLNTNIGVTGADAGLHNLAFQIDGNTALSISATGDGAGGVLARTVQIGVSGAADTVTIGDANAVVGISSATWNITGPGVASGLTTIDASGNITTSAGTFCVGTTCLNETNGVGDNGATLVGAFDEFDNSNGTNVQDVLDDLDAKIGPNAPNVDELTFYPEYPDVVVYKDGSANQGTLVSDYDSGNSRQYYGWTSTKVALNDIDLRFRYELPADFAATGDLTLQLRTLTTAAADNKVDLVLRNDTDNTTCATSAANVSGAPNTWGLVTVPALTIGTCSGTLTAGDIIEIQIKDYAKSTGEADVGKVQLDYTN